MCVTLDNQKYLTRGDLRDMGWDQIKIQDFPHDRTMKSSTGKGRPSYLYLESRVNQAISGNPVAVSAIRKASLANSPGLVAATLPDPMPVICSKPQTISEPMTGFAPYVQVNGTVEIVKPQVKPIKPEATEERVYIPSDDFYGPKMRNRIRVTIQETDGSTTAVPFED